MADGFTTRLRAILQQTNANKNIWGALLNTKAIQLFDDSIAGWASVDVSAGNATLTVGNGATDEARMAFIRSFGAGTTTRTITIPLLEKAYKFKNDYGGQVLVKTSTGVGVIVLPGTMAEIWCNGSETYRASVSGWGKLSTTTLTSGTSSNISIAVTGQKFSDLRIVLTSLTAGAVPSFTYTLTGPGGTTPSSTLLASAGTEVSGGINIDAYALDGGVGYQAAYASTSNPMISPGTNSNFRWRLAGGISSFTLSSSNAFSAGTVEVYLR